MSTAEEDEARTDDRRARSEDSQARTEDRRARTQDRQVRSEVADEAAEQQQAIVAQATDRGLHIAEDIIYALTGLLLVAGALVVLVEAVWEFSTSISDGVIKAVETSVSSLLIVFILVELLSAVRTIITERHLVAEPFLIVGILAAIKEMVSVATFRIDDKNTSDTMLKIGGLAAVVVGLSIAILVLRRSRGWTRAKEEQDKPAPA